MSGLSSGIPYVSIPRVKKTYNAGTQVGLQALLNSLDANTKYKVEIDGIVNLTDYINLSTRNVELVPATEGSGFKMSGGYLFLGYDDWGPADVNRGTALTSSITAGSCQFEIPSGVTLAVGDYVVVSSRDTRANCLVAPSPQNNMRMVEVKQIGYISGTTAYVYKPFEDAMTTGNGVRVLKPTSWGKDIELNGLSFYNNSNIGAFTYGPSKKLIFQDCIFQDPAPSWIALAGGDVACKGVKWLKGLDKTVAGANAAYGVLGGLCQNFTVSDCYVYGWFHEWFSTSGSQDADSHWDGCSGTVENNLIYGVADASVSSYLMDAAIDTHPEGHNITIKNNKIHIVGRQGVVIPNAIRVRSRSTAVVGNEIYGPAVALTGGTHAGTGISIMGGGAVIKGNTIRNCLHGIAISPYVATGNNGTMRKTIIDNNVCIGQITSAVKIHSDEAAVNFERLEVCNNVFTGNKGVGFSGSVAAHIDHTRGSGSMPMHVFANVFEKSSSSHSSIQATVGTSDIKIVGNEMFGFGSDSMGLSGSSASAMTAAYASKNYIDD